MIATGKNDDDKAREARPLASLATSLRLSVRLGSPPHRQMAERLSPPALVTVQEFHNDNGFVADEEFLKVRYGKRYLH